MPFDPSNDSIAITIPFFTLLKREGFGPINRYNEPYIVSVSVDESGRHDPAVNFNFMPFPKVKKGTAVEMIGDGHLIYGPANPGTFVAVTVLIMEADKDIRNFGDKLERIVQSKAVSLGLGSIMSSNPAAAPILGVLKEVTQFVAGELKNNGDDELFRYEGTFLRDGPVPYHVNRRYISANNFVEVATEIKPLSSSNKQGKEVVKLSLAEG